MRHVSRLLAIFDVGSTHFHPEGIIAERVLDKFPSCFLKFVLVRYRTPGDLFGTKENAIDVKNGKESENTTQNHQKCINQKLFRPFPLGKNLKTCLTPAQNSARF